MNYTLGNSTPPSAQWVPTCALCNKDVELETCKIDESGRSIHEKCYFRKVIKSERSNQVIVQPPRSRTPSDSSVVAVLRG
jgi:hypothetical protein